METKKEIKGTVYNVIILDKSGSMQSIRPQAIGGVNETLGTIRAQRRTNPELEQVVTLVSFCSCETRLIVDAQPIEKVSDIAPEDYVPCCCTPLYDAVGNTITRIHGKVEGRDDVAVSVTIITDGYENASREFSGKAVKALIDAYRNEGWLFAYIGADHDVEAVAKGLSINNYMAFEKSEEGTKKMFARERSSRDRWMAKMKHCLSAPAEDRRRLLEEYGEDYFAS